MKKGLLIIAALLARLTLGAYGVSLSDYGFQQTGTHQENNLTSYDCRDANGIPVSLLSANALTDDNAKTLKDLLATLEGWKYLKIDHVRAVFNSDGSSDVVVIPSSFVYKNVNLASYMPSGIELYYNGYIDYDFRMLKDSLFLRLKGQIFDETQFADRLLSAVNDPVLYLQTNDPEYLLQRINDLVGKVAALSEQVTQLTQLTKLTDQDLDAQKLALVTIGNRGLFGGITPVSKDGVAAIVKMKKADPSLTKDQVAAKLDQQGIKMSDKEITLVFGVYFNEF